MGDPTPQKPQRRSGLRSEKEQREVVWPEFIHHSATEFRTPQQMFSDIRKKILNTNHSAEITYSSVPPDWGTLIVDSIDSHEDTERSNAKINYNTVTQTVRIRIMPTLLHECHGNWMRNVEDDWREQNLVTGRQLRNLTMLMSPLQSRFTGPYANSRKEPDYCLKPANEYQPSLVIEMGWTESHRELMEDMRLWMVGGHPYVKIVIIIKFALRRRSNEVTGKVGLYVPDAAGNPVLQQEAVSIVFPFNGGPRDNLTS
jgi:hypothetical protein